VDLDVTGRLLIIYCGFRRNRSTADHIFSICEVLVKKCEYNEAVHQLIIDFKKAYDSIRFNQEGGLV
jgi:hypothetical protein